MTQQDFDIDLVLNKPLMAHLSTLWQGEPRDSPVWFLWQAPDIWLFGRETDSFIKRLRTEPRCALGVVDFDLHRGVLQHVGIRGNAQVTGTDPERLHRFIAKYLGSETAHWNPWFLSHVVHPIDAMVRLTPSSVVANDGSFFKTGPKLAGCDDA